MTSPAIQSVLDKIAKGGLANFNLPAAARQDQQLMSLIKAPEGMELRSYDAVSLEPSVSAQFSGDTFYRYATYDGIGKKPYYDDRLSFILIDDIYLMFASKTTFMGKQIRDAFDQHDLYNLWMTDKDAVKDHPALKKLRKFAKILVLSVERGAGARKVRQSAEERMGWTIPLNTCRDCISEFWDLFSGLKLLKSKLSDIVEQHGAFITPLGFRVSCDPYKAYAYFTQSCGGDVMMLYRHYYHTFAPLAEYVANIHDEHISCNPLTASEECDEAHEKAVQKVNDTLQWEVPIRFSGCKGATLWDLK